MTDGFTHDAAPYVLGALPPEDRRAFEEHLETCPACQAEVRGFAGLPGLLSRLPAGELPEVLQGAPEPQAPASVLPSLLVRARGERRGRRRRAVLVGIAAACIAAAGSAGITGVVTREPAVRAVAFTPASPEIPASAEARLTDVPGGTRIDMTCRYEGEIDGRDREYVLLAVPKGGGTPARLGSWPVLSAADYEMVVVVPMPRGKIDMLQVTNATGRSLLTLRP
jgi:anti-sigma factor RsiW